MTIRMLINATAQHELRIAVVEDGELTELDIEASETSTLKGNVYKGVVHNVEGSLEAAFVDIGRHKQGFLPFSEVSPSQYNRPWNGKGKPKITDVLKRGQEIVVQVAKDAIGEKGVTLTTYLSLPGRYTVLMPESDANGISRKIDDDKVRKRVKSTAQKMNKPEGCGFIVRTAGLGQTRLALQKDLDKVIEQWRKLQKASGIARPPSIIHSEPDLIGRTLRDFFSEEIDEVLIDSKDEFEAAKEYFDEVMPDYADRLVHYQNPIPIFAYHHVEEQIEATFERQVKLPSGGSIVVDETEALVAIDVNSGKMTSEGDHEMTVFKTNCEAAEEAAKQLKLRDLGGIVVVDFIDMEESKNKREVERVLGEAAKEDKARYKISRINSKGLCVLTRQRIRQGMRKAFQYRCPVCTGTGWLRTAESHSLSLLRRVEARLAQGGVGEVRVLTHKETADYILNQKRSELLALERNYNCRIIVSARAEMDRGKDEVTYLSNKEVLDEITDRLPPREDRRSRGGKRKRRKARSGEGDPEPLEGPEIESEAEARSKKRRKRRRGRAGEGDRPEAVEAKAEGGSSSEAKTQRSEPKAETNGQRPEPRSEANGQRPEPEAKSGAKAGRPEPRPEAKARRPEPKTEAPPLEPKGTATFTGRLSPEEIQRAKAERKARKARKEGDHATADRILAELGAPPETPAPKRPKPPAVAAPAPSEESSEMDVNHALAVANAILGEQGEGFDEDAVLEAAGMGTPREPEARADAPEPEARADAPEPEARADGRPRRARADKPEPEPRGDGRPRKARADQPEADASEKEARGDKPEREARGDKPEKGARGDKPEQEARGGKPEREARGDKPEQEARGDKPEPRGDGRPRKARSDEPEARADTPEKEARADAPEKEARGDARPRKARADEPEKEARADARPRKARADEPEARGDAPAKEARADAPEPEARADRRPRKARADAPAKEARADAPEKEARGDAPDRKARAEPRRDADSEEDVPKEPSANEDAEDQEGAEDQGASEDRDDAQAAGGASGDEADGERRERKRRKRRRGRRRRSGDGEGESKPGATSASAQSDGASAHSDRASAQSDEDIDGAASAPDRGAAPRGGVPQVAARRSSEEPPPEVAEARKALLVKIFGAR